MTSTRERILAEAARQLLVNGYAAFTMASVRDALSLSSGSVFHAFASKPSLAAAVYVEGMAAYQRAATAAMRRHDHAEKALRDFVATHLAWVEDHTDLARFLFTTLPREVAVEAGTRLDELNAGYFAAEKEIFARAAEARLMAEIPRPLAHALCIGPAQEYARLWTRGTSLLPPRHVTRRLEDAAIAALASTLPRTLPTTRKERR